MELSPEEIRVLGCLVEKEASTPQSYPLSTNALLAACNQLSSRDPVVAFDETTVTMAMRSLRERELARTIRHDGSRVYKHLHALDRALGLEPAALAVLSVLMLRGPQTPGELRTRCERQHLFSGVDEVEEVLSALAAREQPLVRRLERMPGQKEARWQQLVGEDAAAPGAAAAVSAAGRDPEHATSAPLATPVAALPASADASTEHAIEELRAEIAALRERVETLEALLAD